MSPAFIAVTVGEPAGIGADVLIMLIQKPQPVVPVVFADFRLLTARAQSLGLPCRLYPWTGQTDVLGLGELYGVDLPQAGSLQPQILDPRNVAQVLSCLSYATDACLKGEFTALVTGPVHKATINAAGTTFVGQTEWVASRCGVDVPVMMLASEQLRVAL